MKKLALLFSLCLCGCAQEAIEDDLDNVINTIEMSIEDPLDDFTSSETRLVSSSANFQFENGDLFGIFPTTAKTNGDSQIKFAAKGLSGPSKTVSIDAGAWTTKAGNKFVSYLPYSLYNEDPTMIPASYEGQTQTANNSSAHFVDNVLMASLPVNGVDGKFSFSNRCMASFIRLAIKVPAAATYTKMVLKSSKSNQFGLSGTYDLLDEANKQPFTAKKSSNSLTLNLSNIAVSSGGTLTLYLTAHAPIDYRNNTFTVYLYTSAGQYYTYQSTFPSVTDEKKQRSHNDGMAVSLPETGYSFTGPSTDNSLGTLTGVIE